MARRQKAELKTVKYTRKGVIGRASCTIERTFELVFSMA